MKSKEYYYNILNILFMLTKGSADASIIIWDSLTGKLLKILKGHTKPVRSVAISHDM